MIQGPMSRVEAQPAYILHRRPFKESSFLLDLFTPEYGRVSAVAKGLGGKKSASGAQLQVFQPLLLSWSGKSELKTLTQFEVPAAPLSMPGQSLYCAYYLNELLLYLAPPYADSTALFGYYIDALEELSDSGILDLPLRRFEYRLLQELGLLPDFAVCTSGMAIKAANSYRLSSEQVFEDVSSDPLHPGYQGHVASDFGVYSGKTLTWLSELGHDKQSSSSESVLRDNENDCRQERQEAKMVMRRLINQALNGRPIKSREMLKQMSEVKK